MKEDSSPNYNRYWQMFLLGVVYFVLALASLRLAFHSSNATPVWPASGLAFAALLAGSPKLAPGIFLGAFSANLYVFISHHHIAPFTATWVSLLIGLGNTVEALAGYYLLKRFIPDLKIFALYRSVHSVNWFMVTALFMCLTSCTIGTSAIWLGDIIPFSEFMIVWFTWWTGDVSGILLLTPLLLAWSFREDASLKNFSRMQWMEMLFLFASVVICSATVFGNLVYAGFVFTRAFIIMPFLIWAAIRLNLKMATALVLISAAIAIMGSLEARGPFIGPSLNESLLTVEAFVSVNSMMVLLLNAAAHERKEKEAWLNASKNNLEEIVHARTKELHEKNELLQKRNKELSLFCYAVSHDLQEPLRKIEFFSGRMLEDEKDLSVSGKDNFRRIRLTALRMKQLIENLLSYSIADSNKKPPEATDLYLLLQQVKNDLAERIEQTGAVIESDALPVLKIVPAQIQELFLNIISNSIKFRKPAEPPRITIQCRLLKGSALSGFDAEKDEGYFHLSFADNGIGFEQEYAATIFEILQKLHGQNEYEGTGIGLAICKRVVENHHGFIAAEGQPDKGCTIHVYLPANLANYDSHPPLKAEQDRHLA